ncbi:MAG: DUF4249 domain-containing protein [Bacteroidales bacterium]|nr:DUF4249 domain-containing protein [Bacteroidales bacterium]
MKNLIYIAIALIIFTTACTESYDVELDSSYIRLVVQGSISDELKAHQVSLSKSADYFSNRPADRVTGAIVTISDGENNFDLTEVSDGLYETDTIAGEVGKTYTLTINSEGETYFSSCYLNYCAPIDSINFGYYDYGDYDEYYENIVYILLNALEPATLGNFYLWNVYKNGVLESDTLNKVYFSDDVFVNGNYIYDAMVQWVEDVSVGDTITLEMQSITKEYYDYIIQIMTETEWNAGPFGGPPANPKGNIIEVNDNNNDNDNPLGFFLAYSVELITDTVPEKDEWIELKWY